MPISVPVDQSAFSKVLVISVEPRMAFEFDQVTRQRRETGVQATSPDGSERKWTVQCVVTMPSRFDGGRAQSEIVAVTVTCEVEPQVEEGDRAWFDGLVVGVMNPEKTDEGKITGGRLFWQAVGVRARSLADTP